MKEIKERRGRIIGVKTDLCFLHSSPTTTVPLVGATQKPEPESGL